MTDARLLNQPRLLLAWSASLETERQSFDEWLSDESSSRINQTGRNIHAQNGKDRTRTNVTGHSIRVPDRPLTLAE